MKTKIIIAMLILILLVTACSSENSISQETGSDQPNNLSISEDVFLPEKLGLIGAEFQDTKPELYPLREIPFTNNQLSRKLIDQKGDFAGWIYIFIYNDDNLVDNAFNQISENTYKIQQSFNKNNDEFFNEGNNEIILYRDYYDGIVCKVEKVIIGVVVHNSRAISNDAFLYFIKDIVEELEPIM